MKVHLLFAEHDFDRGAELAPQSDDLVQDLELETLFGAMAAGDQFHFDTARAALLQRLVDPEAIGYRQEALEDCLEHADLVRELYDLAVTGVVGDKTSPIGLFGDSPAMVLMRSIRALEFFVPLLRQLRKTAEEQRGAFRSAAFTQLFAMLCAELDDDYFAEIEAHLKTLRFRGGVLISAELGKGNKGMRYVLRRPHERTWRERWAYSRSGFSFQLPDRDESGARALDELRGRGVNLVANALAQSTDHITSFFAALRSELSFYVGCLNLHGRLQDLGVPTALPAPAPAGERRLRAGKLYDPTLALTLGGEVVPNDIEADGTQLIVVTGANQGGKSTFLRSVGVSQLMMQAGMFVAADSYSANVVTGVFTHYKREEDATMESGKLDEELSRMSDIADLIEADALFLSNESFAATNEREGSQLARTVIRALLEADVKIVFVTHLYDLAHSIAAERHDDVLFLRAERTEDGGRTFRLAPGDPLPTSFGGDLYGEIFGRPLATWPESTVSSTTAPVSS